MRSRALVLLTVAGVGLAACEPEEPVEVAGPELRDLGADQMMVGVETYMTRNGVRQARLRADTAYFFNDRSLVRLRRLHVTFFDGPGTETSRLSALRGSYELSTGNMEAEGSVVVVDTARDRRLETERLRYRTLRNELTSDTSFVWYRGEEVIRGEGFVTDPSLSRIQIERPSGSSPDPGEDVGR